MENHRLPKIMFFGELKDGKRRSGGQIRKFRDNIRDNLKAFGIGEDWMTRAKSQVDWEEYIKKEGFDKAVKIWTEERENNYMKGKERQEEKRKEKEELEIQVDNNNFINPEIVHTVIC